jgi:phosphohistidine phosphatase SixA
MKYLTVLRHAKSAWDQPGLSDHDRPLNERLGSGDGERKTLLTRQIAFEPLPASVLFALVCSKACRSAK